MVVKKQHIYKQYVIHYIIAGVEPTLHNTPRILLIPPQRKALEHCYTRATGTLVSVISVDSGPLTGLVVFNHS